MVTTTKPSSGSQTEILLMFGVKLFYSSSESGFVVMTVKVILELSTNL